MDKLLLLLVFNVGLRLFFSYWCVRPSYAKMSYQQRLCRNNEPLLCQNLPFPVNPLHLLHSPHFFPRHTLLLGIGYHGYQSCFQELVIDQRNDKFCLLISHFTLLWFSYGTWKHSRTSLYTSWHFCGSQDLPASW